MAIIDCNFHSIVLKTKVNIKVAVPQKIGRSTGDNLDLVYDEKCYRVLYLLHGIFDDYSCWSRYTNIERYAETENLLVVMPSVTNSFYCNMAHGQSYYDFISKELPMFIEMLFPVSKKRDDTFIAGLSMGGYGALKIALKNPNKFGAVASLSGAVDIASGFHGLRDMGINPEDVFGNCEALDTSLENIFFLLKQNKDNVKDIPPMFLAVGVEDIMYQPNKRFAELAANLNYEIAFKEDAGGHEWDFWDKYIRDVIQWLPK